MARNTLQCPQGSILGPLPFNIHMCNVFFVAESVDIVSFVCLDDIDLIIEKLEVKASDIFLWFNGTAMKVSSTD